MAMAERIVGLDTPGDDLIMGYLCYVYKKSVDIQVCFRWTPKIIMGQQVEASRIYH